MSNTAQTVTATQLKRALALREKIDKLEGELAAILGSSAPAVASAAPKKRNMSAAGRLAISRAAKARWARERASKKSASK